MAEPERLLVTPLWRRDGWILVHVYMLNNPFLHGAKYDNCSRERTHAAFLCKF